jgi:hypothetical protein
MGKKKAEFIEPHAYPQMLSKAHAIRALQTLQSAHTTAKAQAAMDGYVPMLRDAILEYVEGMEEAGADTARIFAMVHEMRGLAETAGLTSTGRIADILCHYIDEMERVKKPLDPTILALHMAAIARAARTEEENVAMGLKVAAELDALVHRRLVEAGAR